MIRNLLVVLFAAFSLVAQADVIEVEVGGSSTVTPYYSPAHITINQGDEVLWSFVLGTHNVTSTSGPEAFSSGDLASPNDFSFTFDLTGTYFYECTLFDHALTQNGSITVVAVNSVEENEEIAIAIFPNPTRDNLTIQSELNEKIQNVQMFDLQGNLVQNITWSPEQAILRLDDVASGIYFVAVETSNGITRKRVQIVK